MDNLSSLGSYSSINNLVVFPKMVEKISLYKLPFWRELSPLEKEKISDIRKIEGVIGLAFIPKKNSSSLTMVYVQRSSHLDSMDDYISFYVKTLLKGKSLGIIEGFVQDNKLDPDLELVPYGNKEDNYSDKISRLFINNLENFSDKYKNVGVLLLKSVIQVYWGNCRGRIMLVALDATPTYYYKLGFRSQAGDHDEIDRSLENLVVQGKRNSSDFTLNVMYLPYKSTDAWQKEIEENPVRFPKSFDYESKYTSNGDLATNKR